MLRKRMNTVSQTQKPLQPLVFTAREMGQRAFLLHAMQHLRMDHEQFCKRISIPRKTLDKWLAPIGTAESRVMPDMAWSYIQDLLNNFKNVR